MYRGSAYILLAESGSDPSIAQSVEQRGIHFQPTPDYLEELRSQGAKDVLIDTLRGTAPRPLSKEELTQSLAAREDPREIEHKARERGIDFEPSAETLGSLRTAGASQALLQAVREAKRLKPFVAQASAGLNPSRPPATGSGEEGKEATVRCPASESYVPVFASPAADSIVDHLPCGDRVTFIERDSQPFGVDKIQYGGGKVGYVAHQLVGGMGPSTLVGVDVSPPTPNYKPDPPYTKNAHQHRIEDVVSLLMVVDAEGNVIDVQETSKPLGDGLDENAIETVKTWKFSPAKRGGTPVAVRVMLEISFRLFLGPR